MDRAVKRNRYYKHSEGLKHHLSELTEFRRKINKEEENLTDLCRTLHPAIENTFLQMPTKHSPKQTLSWAIKQTLTSLKEQKAHRVCYPTIMEPD